MLLTEKGINRQYFQYRPGAVISVDEPISGWTDYAFHSEVGITSHLDTVLKAEPVTPCVGCGARKITYAYGSRICAYCKGSV